MTDALEVHATLERGAFALDVRLTAPAGVTVLFGPSGSGKSTLLDVVAGFVRPRAGRVSLGADVLLDVSGRVDRPPRSRSVGYVLQSLALFPHLTTLENVAYGLQDRSRIERTRRAETLLCRLGIGHLGRRMPDTLSGGERQRVAIARALAPAPRVLLLDEPFAALDRPRKREAIALVRELVAERAVPALYVTHDPEEAEAIGDRVVVLDAGRVADEGLPLEVFDTPSRFSVAALDRDDNRLQGTVVERRDAEGALAVRAGDVTVLTRPADLVPGTAVVIVVRAADITVALDPPGRTSASNALSGQVTRIEPAGRHMAVHIDCGVRIRAEITPAAQARLDLKPGDRVWAVFKARACYAEPCYSSRR